MATHRVELGSNRTGIASSRALGLDMVEGTTQFAPSTQGDEREIARVRNAYARSADPLGHVPPPLRVQGRALTGLSKRALGRASEESSESGEVAAALNEQSSEAPALLLDQLGARLAFERSGVRLYEALISKYDALGSFENGPSRADLQWIRDAKYAHFRLLERAIQELGGDPTGVTPSADLQATLGKGILEVMVDARTSLPQCLEAALLAELADNESWDALMELAERTGELDLGVHAKRALAEERQHLGHIRGWVRVARGCARTGLRGG